MLDDLWDDYLIGKYRQQTVLEGAWLNENGQDNYQNQVLNPGFESGNISQNWILELHEQAQATMSSDFTSFFEGTKSVKIVVNQTTGTAWHIQFKQNRLTVEKESSYVLQFAARSDRRHLVNAYVMRDNSPWTWYGGTQFELGPNWKTYTLTFTAPENNQGQVRISIDFNNENGNFWFDNFRFSKPVAKSLEPGESLTSKNIRRIEYSERLLFIDQRVTDMAEFYLQLQKSYYTEMYDFLKLQLGVKVPVTGSNALGGPHEVYTMTDLDYVDDHAYWDHPRFPGVPWSPTDWLIHNQSMLTSTFLGTVPSIFGGLALYDKPYTISEYNHAFPNRFQTEMIPVLTAYASFTDTDGLMFFEYNGDSYLDWETDMVEGFFSVHRNNAVMAGFPIFAHVFREGLIQADTDPLLINYTEEDIMHLHRQDNLGRWGKYFPYVHTNALVRSIQTVSFDSDKSEIPELNMPGIPYLTSTGEIWTNPVLGLITITTKDFECFAGNLLNAHLVETSGKLEIEQANGSGVIGWLDLPSASDDQVNRSVLVLTSRLQNRGMIWDGIQTVHDQWGRPPTEILPLHVKAAFNMAVDSIRIFPLDNKGQTRSNSVTYHSQSRNGINFELNQASDRTLWYGIEVFERTTERTDEDYYPRLVVYPNPVGDYLHIHLERAKPGKLVIRLIDFMGSTVMMNYIDNLQEGQDLNLDMQYLPSGIYFLVLTSEDRVFVNRIVKQ